MGLDNKSKGISGFNINPVMDGMQEVIVVATGNNFVKFCCKHLPGALKHNKIHNKNYMKCHKIYKCYQFQFDIKFN